MKLTGTLTGTPMGVLQSADNQLGAANLGAEIAADDGSVFRLALVGASDIAAGVLVQAPALVANHLTRTLATGAVRGAEQVSVPLGATAATAGQYAGGKLVVVDGTGAGTEVGISGHGAAASSGTLLVNLEQPLPVALDNTSVVSLIPNLYKGVIINPASPSSVVVGASPVALAAGTFVWIQVKGTCPLLNDSNTTIGKAISPSASVAGAFITAIAGSPVIGRTIEAGVDTKKHAVYLDM